MAFVVVLSNFAAHALLVAVTFERARQNDGSSPVSTDWQVVRVTR